jgi:hypothetical protein
MRRLAVVAIVMAFDTVNIIRMDYIVAVVTDAIVVAAIVANSHVPLNP